MSCNYCGSSRHVSENCHTLNVTKGILGKLYDPEKLPDYQTMVELNDLLSKDLKELHDEPVNIQKLVNKPQRGERIDV